MAITNTSDRSSWIEAIGYRRVDGPRPMTSLAIFTRHKDTPAAILYVDIPSYLPGLLAAGHTTAKDDGELSIGATYSRLVRGKYPSQTIEGNEQVAQLMEIMS